MTGYILPNWQLGYNTTQQIWYTQNGVQGTAQLGIQGLPKISRLDTLKLSTRYTQLKLSTGYTQLKLSTGYTQLKLSTGYTQLKLSTGYTQFKLSTGYTQLKLSTGYTQLSLCITANSTVCLYPKLICVFVFAYADCWFSHEAAQMILQHKKSVHNSDFLVIFLAVADLDSNYFMKRSIYDQYTSLMILLRL